MVHPDRVVIQIGPHGRLTRTPSEQRWFLKAAERYLRSEQTGTHRKKIPVEQRTRHSRLANLGEMIATANFWPED